MSNAVVSVENVSKRYLVGHQSSRREHYTALRDVLVREARNFTRKALDLVHARQIVQGDDIEEFWALKNVTFEVNDGEVVGIIGKNGAGKSTLLKILSRITEPTAGRVTLRGRMASLLEVGTGFHPELTGRENIFLNGAILGMRRAEIRKKFDDIVEFAEIAQFLDTPVKRYSSGMYVRLAFAVAAYLESDILAVDEVLAVGDAEFQRKCLDKMHDFSKRGRVVLFVSHNMSAVRQLTARSILLSGGKVVFDGRSADAIKAYSDGLHQQIGWSGHIAGHGAHTAIKNVEIVDEQGNSTNQYIPGTPLRMAVTFYTDGSSNLSLEIFLVSQDHQKLAIASLYQFGELTLPPSEGIYRGRIEIEPMWIASGSYLLDVTTSVVNMSWDHYVEGAIAVEVSSLSRGSGVWDFKQSLGYGAFALGLSNPPIFEKM
jgi:lipopolysaccharide transport system ATP-binding protein